MLVKMGILSILFICHKSFKLLIVSRGARHVTLSSESNHPPSPSSTLDLSRELNFSRGGPISINLKDPREVATIQENWENGGLIKLSLGDGR